MNILTSGGFSHWKDSDSANRRGLYVLSCPVALLLWVLETLALLPTGDWLVSIGMVHDYCQMVDQLTNIPGAFADVSSVSNNRTHLFFCIELFAVPILIVALGSRFYCAESERAKKVLKLRNWQVIAKTLLGLTLILPVSILGFLIPGDPSYCSGCTTDSLLGLLIIYGGLAPMSIAWLIAVLFIIYGFVFSHFFNYIRRRASWLRK